MAHVTCLYPLLLLLQIIVLSIEGASMGSRPSHCDGNKNQFDRSPIGNPCHQGTEWNASIGCCTGCQICGPGFRQQPKCIGPCVPCPRGHFSDKRKNLYCESCTICDEVLYREYVKNCTRTSNAECGRCLPGYFEGVDEGTIRCIKVQTEALIKFGDNLGTTPSFEEKPTHEGLHIAIAVVTIIAVVAIICAAVACYKPYIWRCGAKQRQGESELENAESKPQRQMKEANGLCDPLLGELEDCNKKNESQRKLERENVESENSVETKGVEDCKKQNGEKPHAEAEDHVDGTPNSNFEATGSCATTNGKTHSQRPSSSICHDDEQEPNSRHSSLHDGVTVDLHPEQVTLNAQNQENEDFDNVPEYSHYPVQQHSLH